MVRDVSEGSDRMSDVVERVRERGEWFRAEPDLLRFVEVVLSKEGDPTRFLHHKTPTVPGPPPIRAAVRAAMAPHLAAARAARRPREIA